MLTLSTNISLDLKEYMEVPRRVFDRWYCGELLLEWVPVLSESHACARDCKTVPHKGKEEEEEY